MSLQVSRARLSSIGRIGCRRIDGRFRVESGRQHPAAGIDAHEAASVWIAGNFVRNYIERKFPSERDEGSVIVVHAWGVPCPT